MQPNIGYAKLYYLFRVKCQFYVAITTELDGVGLRIQMRLGQRKKSAWNSSHRPQVRHENKFVPNQRGKTNH
jgi:hypothetical protein